MYREQSAYFTWSSPSKRGPNLAANYQGLVTGSLHAPHKDDVAGFIQQCAVTRPVTPGKFKPIQQACQNSIIFPKGDRFKKANSPKKRLNIFPVFQLRNWFNATFDRLNRKMWFCEFKIRDLFVVISSPQLIREVVLPFPASFRLFSFSSHNFTEYKCT